MKYRFLSDLKSGQNGLIRIQQGTPELTASICTEGDKEQRALCQAASPGAAGTFSIGAGSIIAKGYTTNANVSDTVYSFRKDIPITQKHLTEGERKGCPEYYASFDVFKVEVDKATGKATLVPQGTKELSGGRVRELLNSGIEKSADDDLKRLADENKPEGELPTHRFAREAIPIYKGSREAIKNGMAALLEAQANQPRLEQEPNAVCPQDISQNKPLEILTTASVDSGKTKKSVAPAV